MKFLTSLVVITLLCLSIHEITAQKAPPASSFYSILDGGGMPGNFSDGSYWSYFPGGVASMATPGTSDILTIEEDMDLDMDYIYFNYLTVNAGVSLSTTVKNVEVKTGATLVVNGTLEVWDLTFDNGSVISVGSSGVLIVHNDFTNKNNSDDVQIDGNVTVTGTFYNGNGGIVSGSGSITAGTFTGTGTTFGISPNSSITPGATVPLTTLPIELISFTAESDVSGNVVLNWITAVEVNNAYFTIEKTKDGVNYKTVGVYEGARNSNYIIKYSYIDNKPYSGISYYKLKQTDFDGHFTYSDLIQVNHLSFADHMFNVFPNPVKAGQKPYLQMKGMDSNQEVLVVVFNLLGQELYSKVLFTDNNGGVLKAIDPYNRLPEGTYLIIGTSNDQVYKRKLVIK